MIKTLSDAVTIIDFLTKVQGKSVEAAITEAKIPLHLADQVRKYYAPPLEIVAPDLINGNNNEQQLPRCNPDQDSNQQYFGAFQKFLIDERGWTKSTVDTLTETSLDLIRRLPKPDASNSFQERGLVIGYIQSGKTATMSALIARAADEGYRLFIVLGGLWKDLRAQTQRRLDQEVTGDSEDPNDLPLVHHDSNVLPWGRLTQSGPEGDFRAGSSNDFNPNTPKLAVIKKNTRIGSLMRWLAKTHVSLEDIPAIIIDDEADHASIDTNYGRRDDDGEPLDPSKTNKLIRDLLKTLPKSVYIGFTATPFANVLIDADSEDDLYPKDFIATLPEPPRYYGPRKLFGLGMNPSDLSPEEAEKPLLDVIRYVDDDDLDQIDRALKSKGEAPKILSDTLLAFILSCCGRLARGHDKAHFSMLVHPSPQTNPHQIFANAIDEELTLLKQAALRPTRFPSVITRAREMWESDFQRVTNEQNDPELIDYDFDRIWKFAKSIVESIEIKVLNYRSSDKLDYTGVPKRYIVIGGNKLSRGLTLEGLSISLFTRSANQYDTLLQMGRWFGYRPQYYDLTRIYVSRQMAERFAELARVEDELRADLRKYAKQPNPPTPLQLKPRIRVHPSMVVTSRFKMGAAIPVSISFESTIQQTVSFPIENKSLLRKNIDSAHAFISKLPPVSISDTDEGMHIWKDIDSELILEFLESYEFSREARDVNQQNLAGYIRRQNKEKELISWDVVLPKGSNKEEIHRWTDTVFTRKIMRTPITPKSISVLSDPNDILKWKEITGRDMKDPSHACLMLSMIDRKSGEKKDRSFFNDPANAEDILGLVLLFPESHSHETVEYISQS